ncbi:hypothetical protein, partial [Sinorhizobium meliloti]|uniref:hypothetical protein n=1 Tax=Rhizobium meliloti TaxID=382 RepID=UPI001AED0D8B
MAVFREKGKGEFLRPRTCGDALCRSAGVTSRCHLPQDECRGLLRLTTFSSRHWITMFLGR